MKRTDYVFRGDPSREVEHYECEVCGNTKLHKDYYTKAGIKETRDILQHAIAFPEWESIKDDCVLKPNDPEQPEINWYYSGNVEKTDKETGETYIKHSRKYFNSGKVVESWDTRDLLKTA